MKKNLMHHRQEHRWKAILNGEKRVKVSSKAEQYLIKALHAHKDTVAVIDTRTTIVMMKRYSDAVYCILYRRVFDTNFRLFSFSVGVCSHACVFDLYVKLCKILCQPTSS